jgi:hypothetical protein
MLFESEKRFFILELGIDHEIDAVAHRIDPGIRQNFEDFGIGDGGKLLQPFPDGLDILTFLNAEKNKVPDHASTPCK